MNVALPIETLKTLLSFLILKSKRRIQDTLDDLQTAVSNYSPGCMPLEQAIDLHAQVSDYDKDLEMVSELVCLRTLIDLALNGNEVQGSDVFVSSSLIHEFVSKGANFKEFQPLSAMLQMITYYPLMYHRIPHTYLILAVQFMDDAGIKLSNENEARHLCKLCTVNYENT